MGAAQTRGRGETRLDMWSLRCRDSTLEPVEATGTFAARQERECIFVQERRLLQGQCMKGLGLGGSVDSWVSQSFPSADSEMQLGSHLL